MEGLISKFTNSKHKTKKQKSKSKETNENNNFAGKILTEIFPVFFRQEKYIMKKSQYLWNSQQEKEKKKATKLFYPENAANLLFKENIQFHSNFILN